MTPGQSSAEGTIHAGAMDLSGRGTVQVDTGTITNDRPLADTTLSLLEQDDAQSLIQLASAKMVRLLRTEPMIIALPEGKTMMGCTLAMV